MSKHLMKMLDAGFVDVREECASRYYRLGDRAIERLEIEVRALGRRGTDHSSDSWSWPFSD